MQSSFYREKAPNQKKCPHGKRKCYCVACDGASICKYPCPNVGRRICFCLNCRVVRVSPAIKKPYRKCPHGGRKSTCKQCGGVCLCKAPCINAGKLKHFCRDCGGQSYLNRMCSMCRDNRVSRKGCLCHVCSPIPNTQAREREARMAAKLVKWASRNLIPKYTTWNRQNPMADPAQCGKYRPDFIYERPTSVVVIEFDEHQHRSYALRCELARMAEISLGYGGCPVHWVRYNPDSFRVNGIAAEPSDASRSSMLFNQMQWALDCLDYDHLITVTYICYSINSGRRSLSNAGDCSCGMSYLVRRYRFKTVDDYTIWAEGRLAVCEG
jgi:hypothetical protein